MVNRLIVFAALAVVVGVTCGCRRLPTGTITQRQEMATDSAFRIMSMFQPAHTRFTIIQPRKEDEFGAVLASKLREHGFAVNDGGDEKAESSSAIIIKWSVWVGGEKPLTAVVNLDIGGEHLSRMYDLSGESTEAMSYWVKKGS